MTMMTNQDQNDVLDNDCRFLAVNTSDNDRHCRIYGTTALCDHCFLKSVVWDENYNNLTGHQP